MYNYEIIRHEQGLSARILMHSVGHFHVHWHKELELLLVLKGQIEISISGQKYTLTEDDLFLINSGEMHSTAGTGDNILAAVQLDADFCKRTCPELQSMRFDFSTGALKNKTSPLAKELRALMAGIIEEYNKASAGYQLMIEGILNVLTGTLVRNIPRVAVAGAGKLSREIGRVEDILAYINAHYTEKLSLEQLAQNVFLSPSYLSHLFKDKVGLTFQEYLARVRLLEAVRLLEGTDDLIVHIAQACGFASTKAFNKAFRDFYGTTPGEYRTARMPQQLAQLAAGADGGAYMEFDSLQAMEKLRQYAANGPVLLAALSQSTAPSARFCEAQQLRLSVKAGGTAAGAYRGVWNRVGAVGRAWDLQREDLRRHTQMAKEELGIQLLRFHGIFSDEMRVCRRMADGSLQFSWQNTDCILDFLVKLGIAPVLDLTFMPSALASGEETVFFYKGNITPPKSLAEWQLLLESFARHCIARYGQSEVRKWYFEVWNEPDYLVWPRAAAEYYAFFDASAAALRRVDALLRVAGPSIMHPMENTEQWLPGFVQHLNSGAQQLDCFTFHVYGERAAAFTARTRLLSQLGAQDHLRAQVQQYRQQLTQLAHAPKEIMITEYNISAVHKNYLLDTMFPACALLYNALTTDALIDGAAVWTLSDVFEEDAELLPAFSGGFGMLTTQGIRKPIWHALRFLRMLGNEIVQQGEEYIITRKDGEYQILAFCYAHYDYMFKSGDRSLLQYHNRYNVFEQRAPLDIRIVLEGVTGAYKLARYQLDREHGSAFALYEAMGAPACLTAAEAEWLQSAAQPALTVEHCEAAGRLALTMEIPVHGIQMLCLTPAQAEEGRR